jgi:hypothetical protein
MRRRRSTLLTDNESSNKTNAESSRYILKVIKNRAVEVPLPDSSIWHAYIERFRQYDQSIGGAAGSAQWSLVNSLGIFKCTLKRSFGIVMVCTEMEEAYILEHGEFIIQGYR